VLDVDRNIFIPSHFYSLQLHSRLWRASVPRTRRGAFTPAGSTTNHDKATHSMGFHVFRTELHLGRIQCGVAEVFPVVRFASETRQGDFFSRVIYAVDNGFGQSMGKEKSLPTLPDLVYRTVGSANQSVDLRSSRSSTKGSV